MKKKIISIIIIAILPLVFVFFFSFYFYYEALVSRQNSIDTYSILIVEEGMGVDEIATNLASANIISSEFIFKLYLKLNNLDISLQAGEYDIPPNTSVKEIAEILQNGFFDRQITFFEGERVEQYAVRAAEVITKSEQEKQAFIDRFLSYQKTKEGYLFPDTYSYNSSTTPEGLVDWMRDRFEEVIMPILNNNNTGLTNEEVIILASIVEREGRSENDRPVIAGILLNRFNDEYPLQVDATTQYQMANDELKSFNISDVDFWPQIITQDYLESDSEYNTRISMGLPPTAISNPSLESVMAVINSTPTDYYFYIHDKEGYVHYGVTLDEHNQNVAKYLGY